MFYIKEKVTDSLELSAEINDENVFCRCPVCGAEVQVDLEAVFADGDADLFGTSVLCNECSAEVLGGQHDSKQI